VAGAFLDLKAGVAGPESAKQVEARAALLLRILRIWVARAPQLAENCVQRLYGRPVPRGMPNKFGSAILLSGSQSWPGNERGILQGNVGIRIVKYSKKNIYLK
jgi:hypothetical protein